MATLLSILVYLALSTAIFLALAPVVLLWIWLSNGEIGRAPEPDDEKGA